MEYRSNEIKAGVFIVISVLIFIGFLIVIVGLNALAEKDLYRARFSYVGGIEKGSLVRYAGLEVGRIIDLTIPPDGDPRVELVFEVKEGTPVRRDSRAFLTTIGIMGAFYLEVTAGSPDAPRLPPGSLIQSNDVTAFAQMSGSVDGALEGVEELLNRLNDVLNEENRRHLAGTLASISEIADHGSQHFSMLANNLESLSSHLDETTDAFNRLLANNDSSITRSMTNLVELLEISQTSLNHLNSMLAEVDITFKENRAATSEIFKKLNSLTRNLEAFSQSIKEQPWSLVRKHYPPERTLP